jgi:hypothetical protein
VIERHSPQIQLTVGDCDGERVLFELQTHPFAREELAQLWAITSVERNSKHGDARHDGALSLDQKPGETNQYAFEDSQLSRHRKMLPTPPLHNLKILRQVAQLIELVGPPLAD